MALTLLSPRPFPAVESSVYPRNPMRAFLLPIVLAISFCTYAAAQLDDVLKKADSALEHRDTSGLSDDKIIAGLKQALAVSTSKAVATAGKPDGFLKNEAIKILLPPKLETVGRGLRMLGMGEKVDELEVGMNRAAEQATPQAKQIFPGFSQEDDFHRRPPHPHRRRHRRHRIFQAHQFG